MNGLNGRELDTNLIADMYSKNVKYYQDLKGEEPEFDLLRLYFGEDYKINDKIIIHQPSIQTILDMGEKEFFSTIAPFTSNATSFRVQLWDCGIDWNEISDFELFAILIKTLKFNLTSVLFGDIDWTKFDLVAKMTETGKPVPILFSKENQMEIDEETYLKIRKYLCFMFDVKLENEFCKGKSLKEEIIAKARAEEAKKAAEIKGSSMLQMVSFALNHPGFKYKKNELRNVGYVEFIDSIKRLQIYESTRALTQGSYSGFCDVSKIPKEEFNFLRSSI